MKKYLLVIAAVLFLGNFSQAQDKKYQEKAKMEAMKVGYITEELSLTPKVAEKFWPVYHEHEEKMKALRDEKAAIRQKMNAEEISKEELEKLFQAKFNVEKKELDLKIDYHNSLLKVISIEQVARLYKAEHEFKRKLLREIREQAREQRMDERRSKGGPQARKRRN